MTKLKTDAESLQTIVSHSTDLINKILNGNSLEVLKTIPNNSIDCCITSPPYWGLRDYGHDEQLGNEKHFKDFIDNLCNIFDEVQRVLKPTGTCFVNLGDTFNGSKVGNTSNKGYCENTIIDTFKKEKTELPNKSLCMIPERFAIEMINRGWCLRNQVIWHKPNQMPSSAKDRFTVDFEKVFFFVKQPTDYYFEQQLEPYTSPMNRWGGEKLDANGESIWDGGTGQTTYRTRNMRPNEDGKNMRTVWSINTESSTEAHFATYPQRLVERMLKSGCPENGIVLDPFFGSGTTGVYARKVNRNFLGIELNPEYIKIAENRLLKEIGMFL